MTASDPDDVPPVEPRARPQPSGVVLTWRDFLIQLVIITVGVLIALLLEGLVGWTGDRALVREARANILQELRDNLREVDGEIAGLKAREARLDDALRLSEQLLATGKTDVDDIQLGFSLAELSSASWQSAERTGALALMEYRDVQALSQLYSFQDLYTAEQRRSIGQLGAALGTVRTDPTKASRTEIEVFRQNVLALGTALLIERQLAEQLSRSYKQTIASVFE